MPQRPQAVRASSWLLWLLVVAGLGVAVFVAVDNRYIARHWSPLHPHDASVQPVSFVPVVLTLYVVIAGTILLLVSLLRQGQAWARYGLAVLELGMVVGCFAIMRTAPPDEVRWALVLAAAVTAAAFVLLWHPAVGRFVHGVDHGPLDGVEEDSDEQSEEHSDGTVGEAARGRS